MLNFFPGLSRILHLLVLRFSLGKTFLLSVRHLLGFDAPPFILLYLRRMIILLWLPLVGDLTILSEIIVVVMAAAVVVAPMVAAVVVAPTIIVVVVMVAVVVVGPSFALIVDKITTPLSFVDNFMVSPLGPIKLLLTGIILLVLLKSRLL